MEKYDLIIVGAGPAGIFTAVELLRHGSKKKILLVEKGKPVEKRHCPKAELGHCVNCRPTCAITTGFSGAGAFSDGKLSLSYEVGGDLPSLIGEEFAQELIDYTDKIYLEFGADPHVEGIYTGEEIKEIRKNAIHAGLKLVDCPIRHLGTEKAQQLYLAIRNYLADNGVEMLFAAMRQAGVDLRSLLHLRFAAIGKGTAQALADHGIFVDCVPEHFDSRSLAEALIPELTENDRVLLLRAENGSVLLPQLLEQAGKAFDNVPLYTVKTDRRKQELLRQELERTDYVFLASASAARAFAEMTGEISYSAEVVAIGDATAKAAAAAEISVTHIAAQADIDGMIQCICKEEV